jgi:hypothetical protein
MTLAGFSEFLSHATTVAYVVLGLLAFLQWQRQRTRQSGWLAATFLVLGVVLLVAEALPETPRTDSQMLLGKAVIAVLLLFPYFLFRFAATFEKPSPVMEIFAGGMTALTVVWSLFVEFVPEGEPQPPALRVFVMVVLVQWVVLSLIVAIRLWRHGGEVTAPVANKRMRLMSVAATILSVVLVVGGSVPQENIWLDITTQILTLIAAAAFYLGFAPPQWVRNTWRQPAMEAMRRATAGLLSAQSESDVTQIMLPHVARMVGARGVAFFDADGKLLDQHNVNPAMLGATDGRLAGEAQQEQWDDLVVLRFPFGCMAAWTSPYSPFFGTEEFEMLRSMGNFAHLALEQTRAADLKLQVEKATLRRRQALEINDNIVQSLAVAKYAFELGQDEKGKASLDRSLSAAKRIISELLSELDDGEKLEAGLLVRDRPASDHQERSA